MSTWLGRFRIDGTNWEGRDWWLAAGGVSLVREVNKLWPERNALDGTVAGEGHDSRSPNSDHRPTPHTADPAIVRAIDVGENVENDGQAFFDMLLATQDPRIKYVLHEDKIFSSYSRPDREPWEVKPQSVGHFSHVHVSFTNLADHDDSPWSLEGGDDLAHLTEEEQLWLKKFIEETEGINSGPTFPRYLIPWFRKWRSFVPEVFLKRGDNVDLS
jgi:hypothetical protein